MEFVRQASKRKEITNDPIGPSAEGKESIVLHCIALIIRVPGHAMPSARPCYAECQAMPCSLLEHVQVSTRDTSKAFTSCHACSFAASFPRKIAVITSQTNSTTASAVMGDDDGVVGKYSSRAAKMCTAAGGSLHMAPEYGEIPCCSRATHSFAPCAEEIAVANSGLWEEVR